MAENPAPEDAPLRPCPHMKVLLSSLADGSLTGVLRWFTAQHAQGCPHCRPALASLITLREQLKGLSDPRARGNELELTPERRAAIEAAWKEWDAKHSEGQ